MKQTLLIILLCMLFLAGCGKEEAVTAPTMESTVPTEAATEAPETTLPPETEAEETVPEETVPEPEDAAFVKVTDYIPDILVELKYATGDNFVGHDIYRFSDVYLRYGTVKKLAAAQEALREQGLRLKIWDGFRPAQAQHILWNTFPDPKHVSNPETGYSGHCRGNTVDVTLADAQGLELPMPSGFDDFTSLADRDFADCGETEAANATLLQEIMLENGFTAYFGEWWHFADSQDYPVDEFFNPSQISRWFANCMEYISLRVEPDAKAETIIRIPAKAEMTLLGYKDDFALVEYEGQLGYVLSEYLLPVKTAEEEGQKQYITLNKPVYRAVCENFISLRAEADVSAKVITQIPADATFILLEWCDPFAFVDYNGLYGYVLINYIAPNE